MMRVVKMLFAMILSLFFAFEINILEAADKKIVINLAGRSLALYDGETKIRLYPIAIGKPSSPTPVGYYKICSKDKNPTWTDPSNYKNVIPSGPNNPLGYRWMQIYGNYGIHGTNNPKSIGNFVSNGCIRMWEENVEELFELVEIGTPVEINYNRVVVEKTPEGVIAYYIYPDSYDRQNLTVAMIKNWLKGYGVEDFVTNADILAKIKASDGMPTFIGKSYAIILNGKKLKNKAVQTDGVMYLPLNAVSDNLSEKYTWNKETETVSSVFGNVRGIVKSDNIYVDARDLDDLFNVQGSLSKENEFIIGDYVKKDETPAATKNIETQSTNIDEPQASEKATENNAEKIEPAIDKDTVKDENIVKKDKNNAVVKETKETTKRKGKPVIVRKQKMENVK